MERKRIAIIGVGLIGGSLALQLHEKKLSSKLIGVDADAAHAKKAVDLELVDVAMPLDEAIAAFNKSLQIDPGMEEATAKREPLCVNPL